MQCQTPTKRTCSSCVPAISKANVASTTYNAANKRNNTWCGHARTHTLNSSTTDARARERRPATCVGRLEQQNERVAPIVDVLGGDQVAHRKHVDELARDERLNDNNALVQPTIQKKGNLTRPHLHNQIATSVANGRRCEQRAVSDGENDP